MTDTWEGRLEMLAVEMETAQRFRHFDYDQATGLAVAEEQLENPSDKWCGTTGCIAGLACAFALNEMSEEARQTWLDEIGRYDNIGSHQLELDWDQIKGTAFDWLSPPSLEDSIRLRKLFGANRPATRQEAARQVRLVKAGRDPWE